MMVVVYVEIILLLLLLLFLMMLIMIILFFKHNEVLLKLGSPFAFSQLLFIISAQYNLLYSYLISH